MTAVLCLGMFTTVGAEPVADVAVNAGGAGSAEAGDLELLPVPTNLRWSDNFNPQWDVVPEAHGHYKIEIYKDGNPFYATSWSLGFYENKTYEEVSFSPYIMESGSYTFRVASNNSYDPENTIASAYSDWSDAKVYTKPAEQLGITKGWWTSSDGGFNYPGVANAGGYRIYFYKVNDAGECINIGSQWSVSSNIDPEEGNEIFDTNFSHKITEAGKYAIAIQALSADVSKFANGEIGPMSDILDTTKVSEKVEDVIKDLLVKEDPVAALEAVKDLKIDELRTAMQTDDKVLDIMKDLDTAYAAEKDITVGSTVSEEVKQLGVDSSKIQMVGAALNAASGNVSLEVNKAETLKDVNTNRYKKSVQLDIKLNADGTDKSDLEVPITITMPVPTGLDLGKLTILHFCKDGSEEVIHPKNNGDGTITFTVTKFSTFVFAEDHGTGGAEGGDGEGNNDGTNDYVENPSDTTTVISPKTGDNSVSLSIVLLAALATAAGVVASRKENMAR